MMHMMTESCGPLMTAMMGLGWLLGLGFALEQGHDVLRSTA